MRLVRDPGTDLGLARAGGEISQGFGGGDFFCGTMDDDLSFKSDPGEKHGYQRVGGDVGGFAAFVVGKEGESGLIECLEENGSLAGHALGRNGCQCHGVGFVNGEFASLAEPFIELFDGIRREIGPGKAFF